MTEGERIRQARKEAHITQEELGAKLGVSGSMIAQYETGKRNPKHETLLRIAAALGIKWTDLVDESKTHVDNSWLEKMDEVIQEFDAIGSYLKKMGFSVQIRATKYHEVDIEIDGDSDHTHTMQIADESEVVLSKGGYTATFTEAEFEELQAAAKEAIEGRFYKKVLEQST